MGRTSRGDNKSKQQRQQAILRLIQENPISRQETLLEYLSKEGFDATQATISRDIREMNLVKAATTTGYRYVSSHSEALNPKMQARFETIFHESVLGWTLRAMWCLSNAIPAWPMQPARCLTHSSGKMWSAPFLVMIPF